MEIVESPVRDVTHAELSALLAENPAGIAPLVKADKVKLLVFFSGDKRIWTFGEPQDPVRVFVIDTETTGREYGTDRLVEFGGVLVLADRATGQVFRIEDTYNGLQDPGIPIPPEVSKVNGITDDMVAGQEIDRERIRSILKRSDYVMAHNSKFDRPFCEDLLDDFKYVPWLCSLKHVDWAAEGIRGSKLDYIAMCLGYYYAAHRAEVDCVALVEALSMPLPETRRTGLSYALQHVNDIEYDLYAQGAPFEVKDRGGKVVFVVKDVLKKRDYSWLDKSKEGGMKAWHIPLPQAKLASELDWLKENVYGGRAIGLPVMKITALERFSMREGPIEMMYN